MIRKLFSSAAPGTERKSSRRSPSCREAAFDHPQLCCSHATYVIRSPIDSLTLVQSDNRVIYDEIGLGAGGRAKIDGGN